MMMATIVAIVYCSYAAISGLAPAALKFVPELCSAIVALYVVLAGVRQKFQLVAAKYWLVFGTLAFTILCGILVNKVDTGPVIAGMRYYLRPIPFFFLPAVVGFGDRQLWEQMKLVLLVAATQVPLAIYQRMSLLDQGRFTGDYVFGTLQESGVCSIFLIAVVMVLFGLVLRGHVNKSKFMLLFFILLIPTMINETKVTVLLLPLGIFVALFVGSPTGKRLRLVMLGSALLTGFGAVFIPVYDYLIQDRPYAVKITDFFTDQKQVDRYMDTGAAVGTTRQAGREDALMVPLQYLTHDTTRFTFGLGLGNVSRSSIGESFTGRYYQLFKSLSITSASVFMLEIGMLGTALVFLLYWLIFRDAMAVARNDAGLQGAIATGWAAVVAIISVSMFYTSMHAYESVSYLFWYFSGLVASQRMRLAFAAQTRTIPRTRVPGSTLGSAMTQQRY